MCSCTIPERTFYCAESERGAVVEFQLRFNEIENNLQGNFVIACTNIRREGIRTYLQTEQYFRPGQCID